MVGCYAPVSEERVMHGLWMLVEVTLDGRSNMCCVGEGKSGSMMSNVDEIRLRTSWLEVAGSRSGQICAGRLWSEDARSGGSRRGPRRLT
ncbi:hypothetical protein L484_014791 [Morus notabilis]|uniref:Uncharacterized protein n=1 Tax=Morus notabilis TaxID=981085 RepID=W9SA86_9ROSA|nr:hypothetical protein L484_014791 [Morus notabilis]